MKTPKEYLNEISEKKGYTNFMKAFWEGCLDDVETIAVEAMQEYAKQVAEAQREACIKSLTESDNPINDIEAIKKTQLVTDNI